MPRAVTGQRSAAPDRATPDPGEFALVLHTHLPWVAHHGVWPVGEEWLFQAWGHSWLPVTRALLRLAEDGHTDVLTLGVTPMVAAQVSDARLARDLGTWLGGQMWRAEEQRWHVWLDRAVRDLSHHHWAHHQALLDLHERVQAAGGLLAVWRDLADRGVIELLGGPATHPYLPLVDDDAVLDAHLATGLAMHEGWAGRRPAGVWPPELGYRPGLEDAYARHGIDHVLVDTPTMVVAAGGAARDWEVVPAVGDPVADDPDEVVHDGVLVGDTDVVAYARNLPVAQRVWARETGYPGDPWYRDFHTQGSFGTHRSHRVTGLDVPWTDKAPYEPDRALARTAEHAADLHGLLHTVLDPRPGGVVVAAFDTELFGHWWYEGPVWLERLLRRVADDPRLRTTTLASRRARRPPTRRLHGLPRSSWGFDKGEASWVAPATRRMHERITTVEQRARRALRTAVTRDGDAVLGGAPAAQLGRELAQLRCSDWPFMVTRGKAAEYAEDRVHHHAAAAERCCGMLEEARTDSHWLTARAARVPVPADPTLVVRALLADAGLGTPGVTGSGLVRCP